MIDLSWSWTLLGFGASFYFSWVLFAIVWFLVLFCHGESLALFFANKLFKTLLNTTSILAISLVWCWMTDYDGWKTGKLTQPMPIHTTISRVPRQNYQMVRKIIICRCNKYYLCTIVTLCIYQCQWRVGRKVELIVHNVHVTIKVNISFYNTMCFKRAHFPVYANLEFKTNQQMIWSNVWCV